MKKKLSIVIMILGLLIGFSSAVQAQEEDSKLAAQKAFEKLEAYKSFLKQENRVKEGPLLDALKKKVEEALKNVDPFDKGMSGKLEIKRRIILESINLSKIKWDQEDSAKNALDDIQKLGETLQKYKSETKKPFYE